MLLHCIVLEGDLKFTSEDVLKTKLKELVPAAMDKEIYNLLERWDWRWDEYTSKMKIRSSNGSRTPEFYGVFLDLDHHLPELERLLYSAAMGVQEGMKAFVAKAIADLAEKNQKASYLLVGRTIVDYLPSVFMGIPVRENKL